MADFIPPEELAKLLAQGGDAAAKVRGVWSLPGHPGGIAAAVCMLRVVLSSGIVRTEEGACWACWCVVRVYGLRCRSPLACVCACGGSTWPLQHASTGSCRGDGEAQSDWR